MVSENQTLCVYEHAYTLRLSEIEHALINSFATRDYAKQSMEISYLFLFFYKPISCNICTKLEHATCRVVHGGERHVTLALTMKDETLT